MSTLCVASWNVNSIRVRENAVLQWLTKNPQVDILALQELKCTDSQFPSRDLNDMGYQCITSGQPAYNGVALIIKNSCPLPITNIKKDWTHFDDAQKRFLSIECVFNQVELEIICVYCPNGQSLDSDKYQYKIQWFNALSTYLSQSGKSAYRVLMGDFNIAPEDIDVHDPSKWENKVLCSDQERRILKDLLDHHNFSDSFRKCHPDEQSFSWWDYRLNQFRRNNGLRIDLILCSKHLDLIDSQIDKEPRSWERPSDHTPVITTIKLPSDS